MQVTELSRLLKISPDTIRYYTRIGFLTPEKNPGNGYKEYGDADIGRLRFIVNAKKLGFSLSDIEQIIAEAKKGKAACPLVRQLIEQRLSETAQHFEDIRALRNRMNKAVKVWQLKPDKAPTGHEICHLIENWKQEA